MSAGPAARRVGIMGGTFDPIHTGHLILGESAWDQFSLDKVLFMPSGNPPHKKLREGRASNEQRVEMVRRAISGNDHFELSLEEMHDEGYTYTRQTLEKLTAANPGTKYFFIMGADSLLAFDTWRNPEIISRLCVLVAAVRDHLSDSALDDAIESARRKYGADIRKLTTPNIDISSSRIREWISQGKSCRYYLPDGVIDYIREQNIYRTSDGPA